MEHIGVINSVPGFPWVVSRKMGLCSTLVFTVERARKNCATTSSREPFRLVVTSVLSLKL